VIYKILEGVKIKAFESFVFIRIFNFQFDMNDKISKFDQIDQTSFSKICAQLFKFLFLTL